MHAIKSRISQGRNKAFLIVAPLRVATLTWPEEIRKWSEVSDLKFTVLRTAKSYQELENQQSHIYIINYESLPKLCKNYLSKNNNNIAFDGVIFDESTKAKNPRSVRIRQLRPFVFAHCHTRWIMTGTPMANGLKELWAQIYLLDQGKRLSRSYHNFMQTYHIQNAWNRFDVRERDGAREQVAEKISDLVLTLSREEYLKIPDTIELDKEVTLPSKCSDQYNELKNELLLEISQDVVSISNSAVLVNKLLQISAGFIYDDERKALELHDNKITALEKIIKDADTPVLVLTKFKWEAETIIQKLNATLFSEDKLQLWNKGKIPILVANAQSIGHGLNLQFGGRHVVWTTPPWSHELYEQANARIARTGQTEETVVHRIISKNTIDEAVIETLRNREESQQSFLELLRKISISKK